MNKAIDVALILILGCFIVAYLNLLSKTQGQVLTELQKLNSMMEPLIAENLE